MLLGFSDTYDLQQALKRAQSLVTSLEIAIRANAREEPGPLAASLTEAYLFLHSKFVELPSARIRACLRVAHNPRIRQRLPRITALATELGFITADVRSGA